MRDEKKSGFLFSGVNKTDAIGNYKEMKKKRQING